MHHGAFIMCRNEQFQEDLWKRSFDFLKDHLSAETKEKYGPPIDQPKIATPEEAGESATAVPGEEEGEEGKASVATERDEGKQVEVEQNSN